MAWSQGDHRSRRGSTSARLIAQPLLRTFGLVVLLSASMAGLLSSATALRAAPAAELWPRWQAHDPTSTRTIDHRAWEAFLTRYLRIGADGVHRVAYGRVTAEDRAALDAYIAGLAGLPISGYNRAEQLAYWINLYNALVVRVVLDHYPVASIRDIAPSSAQGSAGPWDEQLVEVEGQPISLNDIQNRILRPIWHDPRILYALSCGAVSCPNLQPEPYRADRLEHQLSKAAMVYVNDPRCIRIDGNRLGVSSLYRWYAADFGGSDTAIINHLMAYAEPGLAMTLERFDRISDDDFDWRLNAAAS
jgi:Protein of unknown function, DUF547